MKINLTKKESLDMGWNFNNTYVDLPESLYSMQNPVPVKSPELVIYNKDLGQSLGLNNHLLEGNDGTAILQEIQFLMEHFQLLKLMQDISLAILLS